MSPIFLSDGGLGTRIDANDESQRALLIGDGDSVVVSNPGDTVVYVRFGRSDVEATGACYAIHADTKEDEIMLKGPDGGAGLRFPGGTWAAAICDPGEEGTVIFYRVSR